MQADFVRANTLVTPTPFVPEIRLHLAGEVFELWERTTREALPFWAFAWAGGQALARYVLDRPELVAGRRVLDVASGSGLVAIAAAKAGAKTVVANDVDPFAAAAIELNAAVNGVCLTVERHDMLDAESDYDVVFAGDVCYEKRLADRVFDFLSHATGTVLLGDPDRAYLPAHGMEPLATYDIPVFRQLEDAAVKRTTVWRVERTGYDRSGRP